jgi:hypothetical protein
MVVIENSIFSKNVCEVISLHLNDGNFSIERYVRKLFKQLSAHYLEEQATCIRIAYSTVRLSECGFENCQTKSQPVKTENPPKNFSKIVITFKKV